MFDGSREQFANCFFSNAHNEQITEFCSDHNVTLEINGKKNTLKIK